MTGRQHVPNRVWLTRVGCAHNPLLNPEVVPLAPEQTLILGRDHRFATDDPWMSARHAEVFSKEGRWILRDLGSSNGTRHQGTPRSSGELSHGDLFETGGTFWRFHEQRLAKEIQPATSDDVLTTLNPAFQETISRLRRVARTRVPVMLIGSTGTGKEVLARRLHELSGRAGEFIAINTAAIQTNLIASELFGVERGAHSLAHDARTGLVRQADTGSLLLDEIGDMPLEVQATILRLLQESEVVPVGSDKASKVDVRFICATHQDLDSLIETGEFRGDLFARLKGCRLRIPDLRERPEDLGLLIARFLRRFGAEEKSFAPAAYRALMMYAWPYNVRELERAVESAIAISQTDRIEKNDLPQALLSTMNKPEAHAADISSGEREAELRRLLASHRGNVSAVARASGRSRMQIHRWLKRFRINPDDYR
ncbi:MAG: sigma 54-interacting transcriptional regulator [Myxococcota bacterium]|nr:sigma 54-interacting transcriptional regulator [Myxococcota bacterium]